MMAIEVALPRIFMLGNLTSYLTVFLVFNLLLLDAQQLHAYESPNDHRYEIKMPDAIELFVFLLFGSVFLNLLFAVLILNRFLFAFLLLLFFLLLFAVEKWVRCQFMTVVFRLLLLRCLSEHSAWSFWCFRREVLTMYCYWRCESDDNDD